VSGITLAFLVIQYLWLSPTPRIDFSGLVAEAIICLIPLGGLFVVQHLRPHPRLYWPLMVGLSSLLLSHVTDALDEVRVQPELVGILMEDGLAVLGYALLVWGLAKWIGYNGQIRGEIQALNAGLEQRVAERTASLEAEMAERQQVEQNLRESERRFRDLFEHLPIAYQSLDSAGRWLDANQPMADLLGFPKPEDMIGRSFIDHWDAPSGDLIKANFAHFKKNLKINKELSLRRRDGNPLTILIAGCIQGDDQGRFLRTHCILLDISERRAKEDEIRALNEDLEIKVAERTAEVQAANASLREREAGLQFILEGSRLGTWDWNIATGEVSRNDYWAEMLGYCRQEVDDAKANGWLELIHPEDRERAWQSIQDHLAGRTPLHEVEYRMRTRQGGFRWILDRARIVSRDGTGRPLRMAGTHEDVTDRKQAQQALEESYQRLLTLLNAMEAKIYLADLATHEILFVNQSAARVFGQVEGQACYRVLQGLDGPCPFCTNDKLVNADGSPAGVYAWEFENRLNQRWYDLRDCAVPWTDGRLVRMEIATDITERKQMELRLRQSEQLFRLAFENANSGMCLVDLQGRLMQVNDKMSAIFGYSRQELLGMTVNDLAYPDDRTISPAYMSQAIEGLVESVTFDKRYRHRDGHIIYCQVASSLVRDQQGQPLYFISQVQDVTARREAEEQLRASEQRFRLVVDHALDNIWTMGPDYRLRLLSPSIQSLVGYSVEEYLGLTLDRMLMPGSLAVAQAYFDRLDERQAAGLTLADCPFRGEIELRAMDGSGIWTEIIVTPMEDGAGRLLEFAGVTRDIRERKRYEAQLEQAREAAETATQAKSEFLAHMSHEIRTPLNGVLGLAQVLRREPLSADQQDMVGRIQSAGQSLLAILNDILDFSKIEAGQLRLETRPFHLTGALARVKSLMGPTAQAKGLQVSIAAPEPLGPLLGDELRLEQVLLNLIGNAIKFTDRGEVALSPKLLESSATAVRLRFEVRDTGIGIAPAALAGLFEPFTQAEMGISRRFGGTGLGLSICKRLVELMGGAIGVESEVGEGSTFWFELPFARAEMGESESPPWAAPIPPTGPRLSGVRVLVVDDSAINREVVERALGLEGATATLAADGQQAVQHLQAQPDAFDAVLMDVQMPVMDGLTATRLIRQELGLIDLPIIALTAGVLAKEQQEAREAGLNGLLLKPVDLEQLVAELRKWLPAPRPVGEGCAKGDRSHPV